MPHHYFRITTKAQESLETPAFLLNRLQLREQFSLLNCQF